MSPARVVRRLALLLAIVRLDAGQALAQEPTKAPPPKPKTIFSQPWRPSRGETLGVRDTLPDSATIVRARRDSAAVTAARALRDSTAATIARVRRDSAATATATRGVTPAPADSVPLRRPLVDAAPAPLARSAASSAPDTSIARRRATDSPQMPRAKREAGAGSVGERATEGQPSLTRSPLPEVAAARLPAPPPHVTPPALALARSHQALRLPNAEFPLAVREVNRASAIAAAARRGVDSAARASAAVVSSSPRTSAAALAPPSTRDSGRTSPAPNEQVVKPAVASASTTPPSSLSPASKPVAPATMSPQPAARVVNAAPQNAPGWAHVTYISGATIYIDAGTKAGVREGTLLDVMRGNTRVAELVVAYVSSTRASCTVKSATAPVAIGDSARFTPVAEVVATTRPDSSGATRSARTVAKRRSSRTVRGRIGVRYLTMQMDGDAKATLSQPALDARIDGHNIGGSALGILVDIRAYRQFLTRSGSLTPTPARRFTRVYQTALLWNPVGSATRVAVGRQFSSAISTIGLFDGVSMDYDKAHWSVGGFSGSQPDPASFGYSGDVREHGAYVQMHNAPQQHLIWTLTAGGVGSYAHGKIDREFAYFQGMASTRRFSVYATEELDINRGWKAIAEKSSTTPTAVYATARYSLSDNFTLQVGADSRRSIRLYRDFLSPETAFDDSFRQGQWGGASFTAFSNRLRLSGDARASSGGAAGDANSYTGSLGISRITMLQLGTQLRYTSYNGTAANGSLSSVSVEMNPWGMVRIEANAGARDDRAVPVTTIASDSTATGSGSTGGTPTTTLVSRRTTWFGGDADVGIGRSWYVMFSFYRERGELQRNTQGNVALSWRF